MPANYFLSIIVLALSLSPFGGQKSTSTFSSDDNFKSITISLDVFGPDLLSKPNEDLKKVKPAARLRVVAKNDSDQRILVTILDDFYQNRPQLFKDGKPVPYRKEIGKLVGVKDTQAEFFGRTKFVFVEPY